MIWVQRLIRAVLAFFGADAGTDARLIAETARANAAEARLAETEKRNKAEVEVLNARLETYRRWVRDGVPLADRLDELLSGPGDADSRPAVPVKAPAK